MSTTVVLPAGIAPLAGAFLSTAILVLGQGVVVGSNRRGSGVAYPRAYAEKAEMDANPQAVKFNCAQRAHANTLENLPVLYTMTLITALKYPTLAASALGLWSLARVGYTWGYTTGDAKKRTNVLSVLHYPIVLTLLGASTWTVAQLVLAAM
ncbi:membrane-associated proteins in eicosanoid and glutathione metabolism [Mycena latifolia]|nr:membrane-associated proteins in eicosanoid and glutathione metabolism [Mycena latifolia]